MRGGAGFVGFGNKRIERRIAIVVATCFLIQRPASWANNKQPADKQPMEDGKEEIFRASLKIG